MREIAKSQEVWFSALGWWLARVLIWTSLAARREAISDILKKYL